MAGKLKQILFYTGILTILLTGANNSLANPKITRLQAKLFYQNTGQFSDDIFTTSSDLWNVSFDYVYSTLVIVEVEGGEYGAAKSQRLDFTARYKPFEGPPKIITLRKTVPLWYDQQGKAFLGFWIDNVGCDPVRLSAYIRGQKTIIRKSIDFRCGE